MSSRAKKERAREELARWYRLRPFALSLPILFFLVMLFAPLLRGRSLHPADMGYAAIACAVTTICALLAAWVVWRFWSRRNWIANAIFCFVVAATAIWTAVLTPPQRADARSIAGRSVEAQVDKLKQVAIDTLD